jgi:hypothetical protein
MDGVPFVTRGAAGLVLTLLLMLACAGGISAQDTVLSYDIFNRAGHLTVWLDLTPCLDSRTIEQLKDGIDLVVECQVTLGVPRKLFGDRRIARSSRASLVRFRPVTDDFLLEFLDDSSQIQRQFVSLAGLHQFLHDSVEVSVVALDSLDTRERYTADLQVTSISLTGINIGADRKPPPESESPVRFLFRHFLDMAGYGRTEYQTKSRPFALSELERVE